MWMYVTNTFYSIIAGEKRVGVILFVFIFYINVSHCLQLVTYIIFLVSGLHRIYTLWRIEFILMYKICSRTHFHHGQRWRYTALCKWSCILMPGSTFTPISAEIIHLEPKLKLFAGAFTSYRFNTLTMSLDRQIITHSNSSLNRFEEQLRPSLSPLK